MLVETLIDTCHSLGKDSLFLQSADAFNLSDTPKLVSRQTGKSILQCIRLP
jgi:hypothetical protein